MKIVYISSSAFTDLDFSYVAAQGENVELYFILDLYPKLRKAAALNVANPIEEAKIIPIEDYSDFDNLSPLYKHAKCYVLNRTHNKPWHLSNLKLQGSLNKLIRSINPDLVHFNNYIPLSHFYLFFNRVKKLVSIHDPFPHSGEEHYYNAPKARLIRFLNNKLMKNHLLYNDIQLETYREAFGLHKTNILTSSLGAYEYLDYIPSQPVMNDGIDILFFGRMSPYKGLDILLESCDELSSKGYKFSLTIAGSGDMGVTLDNYKLENVDVNVLNRFVTGEELAGMLKACKFVVCPYKDATQSGVVMSAYALCKPVVASDVGGFSEYIIEGETGLLVEPSNSKELASAIEKLLTSPELQETMSENVRQLYYEGKKSWKEIAKRMLTHYETLI